MSYGKLTRTTTPKILSVLLLTTKEHPYKAKKNLQGSFFIINEKVKNRIYYIIFKIICYQNIDAKKVN